MDFAYDRAMRTHLKLNRLGAALPLLFSLASFAAYPLQQVELAQVTSRQEAQERAAQELEVAARDLALVATRLEALAAESTEAAVEARGKAIEAGRRAKDARKRANLLTPQAGAAKPALGQVPGSILRAAEEREAKNQVKGAGRAPEGSQNRAAKDNVNQASLRGIPVERDKHAAASRSAEENKAFYFQTQRARHDSGPPKTLMRKGFTFGPGEAPDMADLEIRAKWQWSLNVARGKASFQGPGALKLSKTGNIDLARLLLGPDKDAANKGGMKWGMRRYNLGDTTVVDCDFEDITLEHGMYDNLAGHGLYSGNTFHNLGGQAIQIAHRDRAYQQYPADNLSFTGKPILILENNHAADCGQHASRSGFTWTFFDYGTHEHPSTIILRNCTSVHAWDFIRTPSGGESVAETHPRAIRSPGGLMVTQIQHSKNVEQGQQTSYAIEHMVIDNCLFDHTRNSNPIGAIRGVETILIEDSCFISRNGRGNYLDIDDLEGAPSGRIIIQNCVSPPGAEVFLRVRKKKIMSMNCPGQRIEIDLATLKQTISDPQGDAITALQSPLRDRSPASGITKQPQGHSDDLALLEAQLKGQKSKE